jgi:hypothetical protein
VVAESLSQVAGQDLPQPGCPRRLVSPSKLSQSSNGLMQSLLHEIGRIDPQPQTGSHLEAAQEPKVITIMLQRLGVLIVSHCHLLDK